MLSLQCPADVSYVAVTSGLRRTGRGRVLPDWYVPPPSRRTCPSPSGNYRASQKANSFELPLVSRNAVYDCAQDFNVLDLARVDRMQVFG
jgi:hypothetical protein